MILYHGSNVEINEIDLTLCRPYKDFGQGFYLTDIKEQASKMANRVAKIYGGNPVVTAFEFDEKSLKSNELRALVFVNPTSDWASFVMNNRNRNKADTESAQCNTDLKYDIVQGPIANDDLALLFRNFESGFIDINGLKNALTYKKLTNQISFHTNKAITKLKKVGVVNE